MTAVDDSDEDGGGGWRGWAEQWNVTVVDSNKKGAVRGDVNAEARGEERGGKRRRPARGLQQQDPVVDCEKSHNGNHSAGARR